MWVKEKKKEGAMVEKEDYYIAIFITLFLYEWEEKYKRQKRYLFM
jgi:hypothetical protein